MEAHVEMEHLSAYVPGRLQWAEALHPMQDTWQVKVVLCRCIVLRATEICGLFVTAA